MKDKNLMVNLVETGAFGGKFMLHLLFDYHSSIWDAEPETSLLALTFSLNSHLAGLALNRIPQHSQNSLSVKK
jgi:hypothetical protein